MIAYLKGYEAPKVKSMPYEDFYGAVVILALSLHIFNMNISVSPYPSKRNIIASCRIQKPIFRIRARSDHLQISFRPYIKEHLMYGLRSATATFFMIYLCVFVLKMPCFDRSDAWSINDQKHRGRYPSLVLQSASPCSSLGAYRNFVEKVIGAERADSFD